METELNGTVNMTSGSPAGHIIRFALPIFLSQVFQQLYNTADTFIVGKYLGTQALAAVSSSSTLIFLLTSFFIGTSMGAGILISKLYGADNRTGISKAVHTNVAVGLISGVLLTVIGVLFTPVFLEWMNTDQTIMPLAVEYFKYYFWGIITVIMYNVLKGIMNAVGDSKRPLYYLIFSSLLNIGLDLLFIGAFGWGVWSAAAATILSQLASCILCLNHLMKKGHVYTIEIKKIRIHKDMLAAIIKYGVPAGVQNSVIGLANVVVQSQINSFGAMATAAYGVHSKIEGFAFLPIMSFNMAITTFVSQNLGAKEYDRAKKGARFGILAGVLIAEAIGAAVYISAPLLIGIFDNTPEVIMLGTMQARTESLFFFLLAYAHSIASVCRGAGKAFVPMVIMLSIWCVLRIAYIEIIMHTVKEIGYIYWAYPLTWGISCVIYLLYYLKSDWVHGFEKRSERKLLRNGD